jgi:predicted nucleotidyltransferase
MMSEMDLQQLAEKLHMSEREVLIYEGLCAIARRYDVYKVVLFGSRARGTHSPKSDIDLAVYGCSHFRDFQFDVNEQVQTLLKFDIVNMDDTVGQKLIDEINRDGKVLYEKIR